MLRSLLLTALLAMAVAGPAEASAEVASAGAPAKAGAPHSAGAPAEGGAPASAEPRPAPAATPSDPCDDVASLDDAACGGAPFCSRRQRVRIACGLRDALESRYVFFPVKGELIAAPGDGPFDARRHMDACAAEERTVLREDDPLRFYDRIRRCLAAFEDGHLLLSTPARLPQIALGVGLARVDGRLYVANRAPKLLDHLRGAGLPDADAVLAVGNEVAEIDGRPATEALAEVARHVAASSSEARLEKAVDALTRRDFLYPPKAKAALTIVVGGERRVVELPWWIAPEGAAHPMTAAWVRRTGVATTDLLPWRTDGAKDNWDRGAARASGWLRTEPIVPPADAAALREYLDDGGRTAVRFGEVRRRRDRAFCYLQILTFQTENLTSDGRRQAFASALDGMVRECRARNQDLVLDLRANGGGYLSHSSALVSALADRGHTYAGGALVLRATATNQLVYQQRAPATGSAPAASEDDLEPRRIAAVIGDARQAGATFTRAFAERPLAPSPAVGGYSGRVIALVTPACMSACDRAAGMLKASGRAKLLGGPTEGAGGSQQETRALPVRWTDPDELVSVSIPNAAMGFQGAAPRTARMGAEDFFRSSAFENRPVTPDAPYATTVEDVREHNRGWLERVDAELFGPDDAPATKSAGQEPQPARHGQG